MGRPASIPAERKTRIVLSVITGEMSIAEAARREKVSEQSIGRWKADFLEAGKTALVAGKSGPSTREEQLEAEVADHRERAREPHPISHANLAPRDREWRHQLVGGVGEERSLVLDRSLALAHVPDHDLLGRDGRRTDDRKARGDPPRGTPKSYSAAASWLPACSRSHDSTPQSARREG